MSLISSIVILLLSLGAILCAVKVENVWLGDKNKLNVLTTSNLKPIHSLVRQHTIDQAQKHLIRQAKVWRLQHAPHKAEIWNW